VLDEPVVVDAALLTQGQLALQAPLDVLPLPLPWLKDGFAARFALAGAVILLCLGA